MAPIGYGFLHLIFGAAFVGVIVGAIGGAVVWRSRCNLALGTLVTACLLPLMLVVEAEGSVSWLRVKVTFGGPSTALTFLVCTISARWLEAHTTIRPLWIVLAACGLALSLGCLYLLWFKHLLLSPGPWGPLLPGLAADVLLLVVLLLTRRPARP